MLLAYIKLFYKTKGDLELGSLLHFLHDFWRKKFLMLYFINWPNQMIVFSLWDIGNIWKKTLAFISTCFVWITKKQDKKMKISPEWKKLLTWDKKHFSSLLESFQLSEIASNPRGKIWRWSLIYAQYGRMISEHDEARPVNC